MRGRNLRPKQEPGKALARIVKDTADSTMDTFIPLADAQRLYEEGKLASVDMGNAYPNSYIAK